jgi:hypothetical protein
MEILIHKKPNPDKIPGFWEFESNVAYNTDGTVMWTEVPSDSQLRLGNIKHMCYIENALNDKLCDKLVELMNSCKNLQAVSASGHMDLLDKEIGSMRATCWSNSIAACLDNVFRHDKFKIKTATQYVPTDVDISNGNCLYRYHSVSPLLRFMKYENGSFHYPHYDAGYVYKNTNCRTLKSFVIYLTGNDKEFGGSTRFINDEQKDIKTEYRNHADWNRLPYEREVIDRIYPKKGRVLVFDHRICHDVEKYIGSDPRIIIRGDLIYEKI